MGVKSAVGITGGNIVTETACFNEAGKECGLDEFDSGQVQWWTRVNAALKCRVP